MALIAFAVSVLGFAAAPAAQASAAITVTGAGAESSEAVSLATGIYLVQLTYGDNVADSGSTNFVAAVADSSGKVDQSLADDVASENTHRRIIEITQSTEVWVSVQVAAVTATWQVTFEKLSEPTTGVSTLSVSGSGANAGTLYRLNPGTYAVTVTYSGNGSDGPFRLSLIGVGETKQVLIDAGASAGKATTNVPIAKAGTYWFAPVAAEDAHWSVELAPALKLTTTPTPKISGTVKVGRTLKATPGTWKPSGVTLSYQWKRSGGAISGAKKSTYKLTSSDKGKKITVTVTGSKISYVTLAKTSKSTAAVKK